MNFFTARAVTRQHLPFVIQNNWATGASTKQYRFEVPTPDSHSDPVYSVCLLSIQLEVGHLGLALSVVNSMALTASCLLCPPNRELLRGHYPPTDHCGELLRGHYRQTDHCGELTPENISAIPVAI
jgi:hypothetical protein